MFYEIKFNSRVRGPISDGRMQRWVKEYEHDVARKIADKAEEVWVHNLQGSIREPTPFYWLMIHTTEMTPTRFKIDDHDIVYGPWLEGTGSRNSPVTIFPGYHSLRRAKEEMKTERGRIARRILREYRAEGKLI